MKQPVHLGDDELEAVIRAARPLAVHDRDPFLQAVANALREAGEPLGPGVVYRVVATVQRQFWQPPDLSRVAYSRWRRG